VIDQQPIAYAVRPTWMLPPVEHLTQFPLERIATNLARLNRYAGAVEWTVAQHCLLVHELCAGYSKRVKLWGLLHDAHECWIGDVLRPAKQFAGHAITEAERHHDEHIWRLSGFTPTIEERLIVAEKDTAALNHEFTLAETRGTVFEVPVSQWTVKWLWHDRVSCLLLEVSQESKR
jgi:hypothetical protein